MSRTRLVLATLVAAAAAAFLPAVAAGADPQVTITGDANFTTTSNVTIHYAGITPYHKVFVQQCVQPDGPRYDWSRSCIGDRTLVTPLLDKAEGDLTFEVFVGDDPSQSFPYSCGPTGTAGITAYETCYLRFVETDMSDVDHDVFVPITFRGAVARAATTVAATTAAAVPTTAAGAATSGSTTSDPRKVTVSVGTPKTESSSNRGVLFAVSAIAAIVAGAAGTAAFLRAIRRGAAPSEKVGVPR